MHRGFVRGTAGAVAGGSSGIGRATAAAGVDRGGEVVVGSRADSAPTGRVTEPEDATDAIVALLANRAMTGIVVRVDGGGSLG